MNRLKRQPEPPFWAEREARFLGTNLPAKRALHDWQKDRRSLAAWFHDLVRPASEPHLCAYCDGELGTTSSETIDHFIPEHAERALGLCWTNLFPSCQACNSKFKGTSWSCWLLRPDADPVEEWLDCDPEDGRLFPRPELDRRTKARVRLTIRVFGLNAAERRFARVKHLRMLRAILQSPDRAMIGEYASQGPYRLVARRLIEACFGDA